MYTIKAMNSFIEHIDKLPFSVWDGLHISIIQFLIMFIAAIFFSIWLLNRSTKVVVPCLACIALFFIIRDADLIYHKRQQKMIVYNVQRQTAVDFISGISCKYAGDSIALTDATLNNFDIKSSRVKDRVYTNRNELLPNIGNYVMSVDTLKILRLDGITFPPDPVNKITVDVLMLSKNCKQTPFELSKIFNCNYIVADASVPAWKSAKWKKDFEQLHLRFHSVAQQGAFTLKF
jgi:competence protein ComEC